MKKIIFILAFYILFGGLAYGQININNDRSIGVNNPGSVGTVMVLNHVNKNVPIDLYGIWYRNVMEGSIEKSSYSYVNSLSWNSGLGGEIVGLYNYLGAVSPIENSSYTVKGVLNQFQSLQSSRAKLVCIDNGFQKPFTNSQ